MGNLSRLSERLTTCLENIAALAFLSDRGCSTVLNEGPTAYAATMRRRVPGIVRAAVMRVRAGAAEGEFHHMRLTHNRRQLPAQIGDDRAIDLEFRRHRPERALRQ